MEINNYFNKLIDPKIDDVTKSPICIDGISNIISDIYIDLKQNIPKGQFQKELIKIIPTPTFYSWRKGKYPIPIKKLKILLKFWKQKCHKTKKEEKDLYNQCFQQAKFFRAMNSPLIIKIPKTLTEDLAYFLGILYADGSLRNINLTYKQEKRFRWEITVTDEKKNTLETLLHILKQEFNLKTNVKTVYNGRWYRLLFTSMMLHRLLNNVFEMPAGYKKGRLKIPKLIQKAPMNLKKQFIIGFFDGDGWCNKIDKQKYPVIGLSQSSKGILLEIQEILKQLNINFNLYKKHSNNYDYYTLEIKSRSQIALYQKEIGFRYPHKKERLKSLVNNFNQPKAAIS